MRATVAAIDGNCLAWNVESVGRARCTIPYKLLRSILAQARQARWPGTEAVSAERESYGR